MAHSYTFRHTGTGAAISRKAAYRHVVKASKRVDRPLVVVEGVCASAAVEAKAGGIAVNGMVVDDGVGAALALAEGVVELTDTAQGTTR